MLSDLFSDTYTIINQIPASETNAAKVAFKMRRITMCGKKDGLYDKSSETMIYRTNTWTVRTKDWRLYRKPVWTESGYYFLSDDEKAQYFTVCPGDLLIFGEINDSAPVSITEFNELRDKYRNNGGIITGSEVFINYRADGSPWVTNHIKIIKG